MYFDRQGEPLETLAWARLHSDPEYKRVALTELGGYTVSTVWLGLNHNWGQGPPLIFETMVFGGGGSADLDMDRYSTEAQALAGHEETCLLIRATMQETLPELEAESSTDSPDRK